MLRRTLAVLTVALGIGATAGGQDAATTPPPAPPQAKKPGSQGTFSIGGKTYKLAHAVAYEAKVFDDFMIHVLASSEPIAVEKLKAALVDGKGSDDKFITFQPQVKLSFDKKSGEVKFCNANAEGRSFGGSGGGLAGELVIKEGRVTGKAALKSDDGNQKDAAFDLQFDLELIVAMFVPDEKPMKKEKSKPNSKEKDDAAGRERVNRKKGEAAPDAFNAYDLPIPKDATDIERKKLVEHIHFKSPSDVKTVADFLIKQFDAQNWTKEGSDLAGKKSTILKRKKGSSSLTIFVKPDESGSTVTMMATGLSWEEKSPATDETMPKEEATVSHGILVADFPLPDKATSIERSATTKMVACQSDLSAKELVEFYSKSLQKLGWKEKKEETVLVEAAETGLMKFALGKQSIRITIQNGEPKSRTRILILGNGLKWTSETDDLKPEQDK